MSHDQRLGTKHFQIDHFLPEIEGGTSAYENLFWSCAGCNNSKRGHWPTKAQCERGEHYVNPCVETEYGFHLVEKQNGELRALSTCGEYHCARLLLNRPDLARWRAERTALRKKLREARTLLKECRAKSEHSDQLALLELLLDQQEALLKQSIPYIPRSKRR